MKASHTTHMAVLMVLMLTWYPPVPPRAHTLARTALYVVSLPPDPKVMCADLRSHVESTTPSCTTTVPGRTDVPATTVAA